MYINEMWKASGYAHANNANKDIHTLIVFFRPSHMALLLLLLTTEHARNLHHFRRTLETHPHMKYLLPL